MVKKYSPNAVDPGFLKKVSDLLFSSKTLILENVRKWRSFPLTISFVGHVLVIVLFLSFTKVGEKRTDFISVDLIISHTTQNFKDKTPSAEHEGASFNSNGGGLEQNVRGKQKLENVLIKFEKGAKLAEKGKDNLMGLSKVNEKVIKEKSLKNVFVPSITKQISPFRLLNALPSKKPKLSQIRELVATRNTMYVSQVDKTKGSYGRKEMYTNKDWGRYLYHELGNKSGKLKDDEGVESDKEEINISSSVKNNLPTKISVYSISNGTPEEMHSANHTTLLARPVVGNSRPPYPDKAIRNAWEGKVVLDVQILRAGTVGYLKVSSSSGYRALDQAAMKTVKKWKFQPALLSGVAVNSNVKVPIRFKLER